MQQTPLTRERASDWVGATLYSSDGEDLGSVDEVFMDNDTRKPEWLALTSGPLRQKRHLVPVAGAEPRHGGVQVPYSAGQIKGTPELEGREVNQETERVLYSHYGLRYSERRSDTGLPERHGTAPRQRSRRTGTGKTGRTVTRRDREETRDELYAEAKRLGIKGRSKMNKRELARAVGRARGRSGGSPSNKANPVEVQKFLEGVGYPVRKADLIREAERQGASAKVRSTLGRIRDEKFDGPADVSEAIGRLS
jgi:Protein of unknown function (DUF2795)/PRC-barrel domain